MSGASAARKLESNESIGYDLSRFDRRLRVRQAIENEQAATGVRVTARTQARSETKARSVRLPAMVTIALSAVVVLAVMFLTVLNYVELNELSIARANMQNELSELKNAEAKLQIEYDRGLNSRELEEQASALGMVMPASDQITYIGISKADHAEIYGGSDSDSDFLTSVKTFFLAAVDFLN